MIKKLFSAIVFLGLVAVVFVYFISNIVLAKEIEKRLGVEVSVKSVRFSLKEKVVTIKDLIVMNPEQFSERMLVEIPEIVITYNLDRFKEKVLILETIRLDIDRVTFEKTKNGEINFEVLKSFSSVHAGDEQSSRPDVQVLLGDIIYSVNELRYVNKALPVPVHQDIQLNLHNQKLESVQSVAGLAKLILIETLKRSLGAVPFPGIASFIGSWSDSASNFLDMAGQALTGFLNQMANGASK